MMIWPRPQTKHTSDIAVKLKGESITHMRSSRPPPFPVVAPRRGVCAQRLSPFFFFVTIHMRLRVAPDATNCRQHLQCGVRRPTEVRFVEHFTHTHTHTTHTCATSNTPVYLCLPACPQGAALREHFRARKAAVLGPVSRHEASGSDAAGPVARSNWLLRPPPQASGTH